MQTPQQREFVNFALRIAAGRYEYSQRNGRCDPLRYGISDCSGLVVGGTRHVGGVIECTGSYAESRMCHAAGTTISLELARRTPAALVFIGPNEGQGLLDGSADGRAGWPGHVAISLGDGRVVEARNSRAGILTGPFDGRGWVYAAMPPWFPTTTGDDTADDELVDEKEILLTTIASPQRGKPTGRTPTARPVPAYGVVLLENGATVEGDKVSGKKRTWRHADVDKVAKNAPLVDIAPSVYPHGHDRAGEPDGKGFVALYDLGGGDVAPYRATWREQR